MRSRDLSPWIHTHVFDEGNLAAEKGTRLVMLITAATMVIEIAAGWWYNSMALLADGWHMSSHAVAIGLSALAYAAARRYAATIALPSAPGKSKCSPASPAPSSCIGVALMMVAGSVERIFSPQPIRFSEAIVVAVLGLAVNVVCALILGGAHDHGHGHARSRLMVSITMITTTTTTMTAHEHAHHGHGDHDLNLRAAYLHVIADAATSVLAIVALLGGMLYGWDWLDPLMGIVGASSRRPLGAGTDPRYRPCAP
jgi:cation diffusion facilitator family transporter